RRSSSQSTKRFQRFIGTSRGKPRHRRAAGVLQIPAAKLLGIAFRFCCTFPRLFPPRRTRRQPSKYAHYNSLVATYHVENFGCRATQADGAAIERQLLARGLERASEVLDMISRH